MDNRDGIKNRKKNRKKQKVIQTALIDIEQNGEYSDKIQFRSDKEVEKELMRSLQSLNDIQSSLLSIVESQDEKIDTIENNMVETEELIQGGTQDLEISQRYHFNYKPIFLGVLLGGLAMGPMGIMLNIKLGSIFTLGGSIMGGYTGYKIQK